MIVILLCIVTARLFSFSQTTNCYFENGYQETKVYHLENLSFGHSIEGPAIIMNGNRY